MADEDMDRRGWHLSKGIDLAHLLTTLALIVAGLWFLAGQDRRISNLELSLEYINRAQVAEQDRTERRFSDLQTDLRMINEKLDRLIESRNGR